VSYGFTLMTGQVQHLPWTLLKGLESMQQGVGGKQAH